jgi:aryl-alcohol dehydrogenase-like predicted oxidoreductase
LIGRGIAMEYRRLGNSGLKVSAVGLGANNFGRRLDERGSARVIDQALDLGINFIDTANVYSKGGSEECIGKALKGKRDRAIVATKFGRVMGDGPNERGASRLHIMNEAEASLRRLQTDYIDLYQLHIHDPETPIAETLMALEDLIRQGKVRYIGCSGVTAWQACEALWTSRMLKIHGFVSVQPYYNLLRRDAEKELIPFCRAYGLGVIPYFPLESGFLTGKYRRGEPPPPGTRFAGSMMGLREAACTERNFAILENLESFCKKQGRPVGELAIAWLLADPTVSTVIAGATKPEQVVANAKACTWKLTDDELGAIDQITLGGER